MDLPDRCEPTDGDGLHMTSWIAGVAALRWSREYGHAGKRAREHVVDRAGQCRSTESFRASIPPACKTPSLEKNGIVRGPSTATMSPRVI